MAAAYIRTLPAVGSPGVRERSYFPSPPRPPSKRSTGVIPGLSPELRTVGVTKGVTVRTGTGFGARWKTEKRAALIVAAMAMMARLKPLVGAILFSFAGA